MSGYPALARSEISIPDCEVLSKEDFQHLMQRYHNGDLDAKSKIIQHNLRLVMSIAQRFSGRGEIEDLFQIGCLGLLKAVEKFNPIYEVQFSTYAVPLIIGEIKQFLRDEGPIKISRSIKETATKIEQIRSELGFTLGYEPTLAELEKASGFSREEIAAALEAIRPINSLQEFLSDGEADGRVLEDLVGGEQNYNNWLENYALQEILNKLPPRLKELVELRFFEEKTQSEIAAIFGVSQVQISRLEKEALHKLRNLYE